MYYFQSPDNYKVHTFRSFLAFIAGVVGFGAMTCMPVSGQDQAASFEKVWQSGGKDIQDSPMLSAPMVDLTQFKGSSLVLKGGWPGLGPFSSGAGSAGEMTDARKNKLKVLVNKDRVVAAELKLVPVKGEPIDILDLTMSTDFLLEAVGLKPANIDDFNRSLARAQEGVLNNGPDEPTRLHAGRYLVSIRKDGAAEKASFSIKVKSRDASKDAIAEHARAQAARDARLKKSFLSVIETWQNVKQDVVKERKTTELPKILAGKALNKQTNFVKWMTKNKKHYDMTSKGVQIERFEEVEPDRKYQVFAHVAESMKLVSDVSGDVLKESDDAYDVNYTIEKIGDNWFITDSAIISASNKGVSSR